VLAVLAAYVTLACLIRPRGLLWPRRWRQRWRAKVRHGVRGKNDRIGARLRREVLAADRHRCVACGFAPKQVGRGKRARWPGLQIDHITPWIMGGLTWKPNLATLCKSCNGCKGIYWVSPEGKVYYHATWGPSDLYRAVRIHAAEVHARRNPLRAARLAG